MKKNYQKLVILTFACFLVAGCDSKTKSDTSNKEITSSFVKEGTYISFLGDSISTFDGYSNDKKANYSCYFNPIWFPNDWGDFENPIATVENTWWYQVTKNLNYNLCVNNSYSGGNVIDEATWKTRAKNLHQEKPRIDPDVIVIYMGVNDFNHGFQLGSNDGTKEVDGVPATFTDAYCKTLDAISKNYANSKVFCCTPLFDQSKFNVNAAGFTQPQFYDGIRTIVKNRGLNIIDLYNDTGINDQNIASYTFDCLHPNIEGMKKIADVVTSAISKSI